MKILFLYTELAGYFLSCIEALTQKNEVEIHIVKWSVNKEAPFVFNFPEKVKVHEKNNFPLNELKKLVREISPDLIYCSGWMDKDYIKICKEYKRKIPVIVGFDSQWKGTVKQRMAVIASSILIKNHFSHCWVPGQRQIDFGERLGFKKQNIYTGFYSADFSFFNKFYLKNHESKKRNFPKRFIYAGRYYDFKGVKDLWKAFIELQNESPNAWELWCLGTGDIAPVQHPKIKHFGFVQPKEMDKYIAATGVFILPSRVEPWGVVVHEFAAAGFPLICSHEVGAADAFLIEKENGFIFKAKNVEELKSSMHKMISLPDEKLFAMGEKSNILAQQITPDKWANTLMSILNNNVRN